MFCQVAFVVAAFSKVLFESSSTRKVAIVSVAFVSGFAFDNSNANAESPFWVSPPKLSMTTQSPSRIKFDVPSILNCREVTTEEFANTHSLEKLLEVRLRVSSLVENGSDQQIQELFFLAYSPEKSFRIVDFTPTTSVLTEHAGPIETSQNRENANNAGLNFQPTIELAGKASINANISDKNGESRRTSMLPPMKQVVASGTQNRESAAYFKFRPNSQSTLEGSQEITLIIQVPINWRADIMHIHCRGITLKSKETERSLLSRNDFVVPLHVENDAAAKLNCDEYLRAESNFRRIGSKEKTASSSTSANKKDLVSKIGKFLKTTVSKPKRESTLPKNWMGNVVFAKSYKTYEAKLSTGTQNAVQQLARTRKAIVEMSK